MDILSKSDPYCILYIKETIDQEEWFKFGQTEVKDDNLNPVFDKSFKLNYYFEK